MVFVDVVSCKVINFILVGVFFYFIKTINFDFKIF
jgi:hypothetical protein